nr:MASE3 domain-containing protein [Limihaloglobus sulfuriphilus]
MIIELFVVIVSFCIFILAWNSRSFTNNRFLIFIGIAYLAIGFFDMFHFIAYKGISILYEDGSNQSAQFWIAARYIESLSLLVLPRFASKKISEQTMLLVYGLATSFLMMSIAYWEFFPVCYAGGEGFTAFKTNSEYLISAIFFASAIVIFSRRKQLGGEFVLLLITAVILKVFFEIIFFSFPNVYARTYFAAHIVRAGSFYLVFRAIVQAGLMMPYTRVFENLKKAQQQQREAIGHLEEIVEKRTIELKKGKDDLQALAIKLLSFQEEEHKRLALELHDDLTQRIAYLAIEIGRVEMAARKAKESVIGQDLAKVNGELADLSTFIHDMSRQLHPSILDELGILEAVRSECRIQSLHSESVEIICRAESPPEKLPPRESLFVYRIIQESLRNACKHSGCTRIEVVFDDRPNTLKVEIIDNGKGFMPEKLSGKGHHGIGLASMKERAVLIRAKLEIISAPDKGTTVSLLVVKPNDY